MADGSQATRYTTKPPRLQTQREKNIVEESLQEFKQMVNWRNVFAAQWNEVAELILPDSRNTFQYMNFNWPGEKKTQRQIDATGMLALEKFSAIMDSLLTPKNMRWHILTASDPQLMKNRSVRLWFEQVTNILFQLRYAGMSGFAGQNNNNYLQIGAFGTMGMFIDELDQFSYPATKGIRYKSIPMGELFIRENHQGIVDGFTRWFKYDARQAYQKWGPMGTFPVELQTALDAKSPMPHDFIHRVVPRTDYDPERLDGRQFPYASYYISIKGEVLLQEGGYRMMPAAIGRWKQAPNEVYGRSPAMSVLPSLKTLNAQKATFLKQGHRIVDPVLLTADDGIVDVSLRPGALNKGGVTADGKELIKVLPTGNIQTSIEMMAEEKNLIEESFLVALFKIALQAENLPQMTATQIIEMVNQKGILIAPTVGRQEGEYLSVMIEREIDVASYLGLLPPMPPLLREAKGQYKVESTSPLARMAKAQEAAGGLRTLEVAKEMAAVTQDMSVFDVFDLDVMLPAIADIQGMPESWRADDAAMQRKRQARAQAQARQEQIQAMPAMAAMKKADAVQAKAGIGPMPPPGQLPAGGGPPLQEQVAR